MFYIAVYHVLGEPKTKAELSGSSSIHSGKGGMAEAPSVHPIRLGNYEVIRILSNRIGKGGYGSVFKGKDTSTNDAVAVKIVEKNKKTMKYIDREIKLLKACKHKNIVEVFYIETSTTELFIVMEYCSAGSLSQYVEKNSITYERCVSFMEDITAAVDFLHNKKKVYHRDIKPDNVLISDPTVAKLADFGLAKEYYVPVSSSIASGTVVGTPCWMPPEMTQGRSKYDLAVDIFPLGLLFHAMVCRLPNRGSLHPITGEYPYT